jgi:TM2 domain-containing membrane protein YozV
MSTQLVRSERNPVLGYVLWAACFFGFFGIHRIYAGRWASGLLWFFTFGLCGMGQLVDVFFVPRMIQDHNEGRPVW